jgi:hypothetical protein
MGFKRGVINLKFTGEFDGLEIRMRRLPIGDLLAVSKLADIGKDLVSAANNSLDMLLGTMAANILEWNLEDEVSGNIVEITKGSPSHVEMMSGEEVYVPSSGLYSLDISLVLKIVDVWVTEAAGVTEEMGKASMSGNLPKIKPQEEFQLMEALSLSQDVLPEHESLTGVSPATADTH